MCVSQCRWTSDVGPCPPAPTLILLLLLPLSFLSSSSPPLAQGAIHIPKDLSQPPVLTKILTSYTAFSREDIYLPCEASGHPTPSFRWVKDGRPFGAEQKGSGTLRVDEDEPLNSYQGYYRCYASNTLGTAMTQTVEVIVEPQPVLLKQQKVHMRAYEGESIILSCHPPNSSTPPYIHWMDKRMVHIKQSERVMVGLDGNLYFSNVIKSDSRDDYICNAQPTPKVEWEKKDGNLDETSGQVDNYNRWLHFNSITQYDDGEYECRAINTHGSTLHSFTITVEAAPYWVKEPQNLMYAPGETVRLDCQAEGIPTPSITWSINGQPLTGTNECLFELTCVNKQKQLSVFLFLKFLKKKEVDDDPRRTVSGGVFKLTDVEFADTAVYQCEASNKHGSILLNTYLYVVELPPQILSSDGVVYRVTEGRRTELHCASFGSPQPHVTWEGEAMVPLLSDPRISLLTNGTLKLSNISHADGGVYTCSVENTNISITAHLEVFNRTMIVTKPQDVRALRGSSALLDCSFYKDPQLIYYQIVWRRDGHKLQESPPDDKFTIFENGTLKVTDVQSGDTAPYSCEVITDLDHVTAGGSITVVEFIVEGREEQHSEEGKWRWEEWKRVPGDFNHMQLTLHPYCTYRFRVIAVNELGYSDPSKASDFHSTPPAVPGHNPTGVRSESTDPGTLIITWNEMHKRLHNGHGFQYKVSWREAGGQSVNWNHSYIRSSPFLVNETGTYTPFEIKVQAVNSLGEGPEPKPEIGHSGEDKPEEPPSIIAVKVMNSTVRVRWNEAQRVRGLLLGYKIYIRRLGPQGARGRRSLRKLHHKEMEQEGRPEQVNEKDEGKKLLVVVVHGMKTSEEVTGLQLFSLYKLTVTAFNSKGESPPSPEHHFSTPEGVPGPPASLRFESPSEKSLILYWTPPTEPNGILQGYVVQYQQELESRDAHHLSHMEFFIDPSSTHIVLEPLDPNSHYIFQVIARTGVGDGPPITRRGATLLDGVPPSNITIIPSNTSLNLSWVPGERHRNHGFHIHYLQKSAGGQWVESEVVNSTQGFHSLTGLQPGTRYHLKIMHKNYTLWGAETWTVGQGPSEVTSGFATQGWLIGLISAVVLLVLILLILFLIKRSKGVKGKEDKEVDSEVRPMKDETFGEYSDADEKRSDSQPSLCGDSKLGSDDSLAEYGDSVDIQFNEDGSFIGQYSGRGPVPHGNESSGPASPVNAVPPPPIAPSMSTILNRPS
ncbi:hypothetical protein PAMP_011548 [Pampus punctatissimus]